MSAGVGIFKYTSLMGIFPLPPPPTMNISPFNIIYSFINGSLKSYNPWMVPHPEDVESYRASMPLSVVDIVDPMISSTSANIG
jgi:hypothetical protein